MTGEAAGTPPFAVTESAGTAAARLASFAVLTDADALPSELRTRAKLHLLDVIGCGLAAGDSAAARATTALALDDEGRPEASIIGASRMAPAPVAALANGTRCHALDFDDTHEAGICHSTTVVGPAALAMAEATGASGSELLTAYVLGSEVALRIAVAVADGLYERGFHPTSVCGAFGAAGAACRLLRLDSARTTAALGIVGSFAAGLLEYLSDGSATKPLHAGWAAQAGIQAARMARAGATGPSTVIEGPLGLVRSHGCELATVGDVTDALGERWEVAQLAIKPFPACHFGHACTWAASELATEHSLAPQDIAEIVVRIPPEGGPLVLTPLTAKRVPRSPYDAKFSLPFMIAHQLVHGRLELASFSAQSIRDPEVLALAQRVRGEPLDRPAPSRFAGGVRVITRDGDELDRFLAHAPGSPRNPLAEEWVLSKFRSNAGRSLDPADVREAADVLRSIDAAPSLNGIAALLRTS
jgi:2-methylcitrate dehydratase PrpD